MPSPPTLTLEHSLTWGQWTSRGGRNGRSHWRSIFTSISYCLSELRRCVVRKSSQGEDNSVQIPQWALTPRSSIPLTWWNVCDPPDPHHHCGFRLATPELCLTTCRAAWSPVTDSAGRIKWVSCIWPPVCYPALYLISIQHCRARLAGAFLPSLSSNSWTWFICHERIWNAAASICPTRASEEQAVDQARQHWWQEKASSTGHIYRVIYTER